MIERRKLLSLIVIAFLVLVLPIALLLSRQRQEIRKKASDVSGIREGNLRVSPVTVSVGQAVNVYIEGTGDDAYGYIAGKLNYDANYFEPVEPNQVWTSLVPAQTFFANGQSFIFGANSSSSLLTGQILKLTLRAKQISSASNFSLVAIDNDHPLGGILSGGQARIFGSGTNGINVEIMSASTASPTPTPTSTAVVTPTPTRTATPIVTPPSTGPASFTLTPASTSVGSAPVLVEIRVNSGGRTVQGAQAVINVDPKLSIVNSTGGAATSIMAGDTSLTLVMSNSVSANKITFFATKQTPQTPATAINGVLAKFYVKTAQTSGTAILTFQTGEGETDSFVNDTNSVNILGMASPLTINLGTTTTPSPTPTATARPDSGVPGDVNMNGCVGSCDTSFVINHYQSGCYPNAVPVTPTSASNGDFNRDGCVDDLDINTVKVNSSLCANDCSQ